MLAYGRTVNRNTFMRARVLRRSKGSYSTDRMRSKRRRHVMMRVYEAWRFLPCRIKEFKNKIETAVSHRVESFELHLIAGNTYDSHVVEADGGTVHSDAEEGHEETL